MDQLCKRIDSYYDNMVSTLETLVNIDSGADSLKTRLMC